MSVHIGIYKNYISIIYNHFYASASIILNCDSNVNSKFWQLYE